ncbi:cation efflux system protein czcD [Metarhizium rileyi]|uniref:Cation efflux system protein czcD n=1 Tax=Metarhizium rileyi (strain RCEF 4871) TaxID=1649241 RepID=A0A162LZI6_METRR|nr:cation efflux system protein czcD [Metarhizium rileyi RCEF 4871]
MAAFTLKRKQRLIATIVISAAFFLAELIAGCYTHSLALIADSFHYLSDLVGFVVALIAITVSERSQPAPKEFTFGWQRATLLGAFFNGVFLLALGISILVQAVERFTHTAHIDGPKVVLIVGCAGLGLNLLVMSFLHEHDHRHGHCNQDYASDADDGLSAMADDFGNKTGGGRKVAEVSSHNRHKHSSFIPSKPGRDLGLFGVFIHVVGDAINNVGVIISAFVIWKLDSPARYYADPAIGIFIAIMIFLTAIPLTKSSGSILLQIAPRGMDLEDVKHDIEMIPGIESVHELHIWRLDQQKVVASVHVVIHDGTIKHFTDTAKIVMECLHAYGVHSATLQPEVLPAVAGNVEDASDTTNEATVHERRASRSACQLICGSACEGMRCCT